MRGLRGGAACTRAPGETSWVSRLTAMERESVPTRWACWTPSSVSERAALAKSAERSASFCPRAGRTPDRRPLLCARTNTLVEGREVRLLEVGLGGVAGLADLTFV